MSAGLEGANFDPLDNFDAPFSGDLSADSLTQVREEKMPSSPATIEAFEERAAKFDSNRYAREKVEIAPLQGEELQTFVELFSQQFTLLKVVIRSADEVSRRQRHSSDSDAFGRLCQYVGSPSLDGWRGHHSEPYVRNRADVVRELKDHQSVYLPCLSVGINRLLQQTIISDGGIYSISSAQDYEDMLFSGTDANARLAGLDPQLVSSVLALQANNHAVFKTQFADTLTKLRAFIDKYSQPENRNEVLEEQNVLPRLTEVLELIVDGNLHRQEPRYELNDGLDSLIRKELRDVTNLTFPSLDDPSLLLARELLSDAVDILRYHGSFPEPTEDRTRLMEKIYLGTLNKLREQILANTPSTLTADQIAEKIIDAAYIFGRAQTTHLLSSSCIYKVGRWMIAEEGGYEQVRFLLEKELSDPSYFQKYPLVMGYQLYELPRGRLVTQDDIPPEWLEVSGGRCGSSPPQFATRKFSWGHAQAIYREAVLD